MNKGKVVDHNKNQGSINTFSPEQINSIFSEENAVDLSKISICYNFQQPNSQAKPKVTVIYDESVLPNNSNNIFYNYYMSQQRAFSKKD